MAEPSRGLIYLPIIYLWTGGVEGFVLASLGPPVHLSGERLGLTLLVCMVSDFRRGRLEVSWRSPSEGIMSSYSLAVNRKHRGHSAVAVITVATRDWPSYSCSVTRRRRSKAIKKRHSTASDHQNKIFAGYEEIEMEIDDVAVWTNTVVVIVMRLLFMKFTVFNTLMTIYLVIKWCRRL